MARDKAEGIKKAAPAPAPAAPALAAAPAAAAPDGNSLVAAEDAALPSPTPPSGKLEGYEGRDSSHPAVEAALAADAARIAKGPPPKKKRPPPKKKPPAAAKRSPMVKQPRPLTKFVNGQEPALRGGPGNVLCGVSISVEQAQRWKSAESLLAVLAVEAGISGRDLGREMGERLFVSVF